MAPNLKRFLPNPSYRLLELKARKNFLKFFKADVIPNLGQWGAFHQPRNRPPPLDLIARGEDAFEVFFGNFIIPEVRKIFGHCECIVARIDQQK